MFPRHRHQPFILILSICVVGSYARADSPTPTEVFNQRILPIFRSENPSSCIQCHLASVDLKDYLLPSSDATFASLREQGLIDLDQPEESKILKLIGMGEKDPDESARMIHEKMRRAEQEAFAAWIASCCADDRLRNLPITEALAKPAAPDAVIRHARKSRIVDSFVRNVWSQRMRCFPCHTPHEIDPNNPQHKAALKTQAKFRETYDDAMLTRLAIFKETPEATLNALLESSHQTPDDRLPLLNLAEPENSLLLQKPLSKLPPKNEDGTFAPPAYQLPVSHMGGLKMHPNDQSYKSIVSWITDYSQIFVGKYKTVEQLPADNWYPTKRVLRLKNAPEDWPTARTVQLFVYSWDEHQSTWSSEPIAFTQGTVTPRRIVNGNLSLLGSEQTRSTDWFKNASLPPGRYLAKIYLDRHDKIASDPSAFLSQQDFQGQIELPQANWREGFRFAEVINGVALGR